MAGTVGIIVNPAAGKDVRRLFAPTGHSPDTGKIGIVRRVALGALDAGAAQIMIAHDAAAIGRRAIDDLDRCGIVPGPGTGSALDTRRGATEMRDLGASCVVVLGGDGTCRDVAIGWPDVVMIALSTGTNNVFPRLLDGSSAGTAAGLVAARPDVAHAATTRSKRLSITIRRGDETIGHDVALVDVAVLAGRHTGARAVTDAAGILAVVAAIATPVSAGLSSIAGRAAPLSPEADGARVIHLSSSGARRIRVPLMPGAHATVGVAGTDTLASGGSVRFAGPVVLAYDGERERVVPVDGEAIVTVDRDGPWVVDVDRLLRCAAAQQLFDEMEFTDGN